MKCVVRVLVVLLPLCTPAHQVTPPLRQLLTTHAALSGLEDSPLREVRGVVGGRVLLPCDLHPPRHEDSTHLVLFYHGNGGTPIYSVDARKVALPRANHWAETGLKGRATLSLDRGQPGLVLHEVLKSDEGDYRCRVDFLESPTRNLRIRLDVVVPPRRLTVTTQYSPDVGVMKVAGPFPVAAQVTLFCLVMGGQPRPQVTWWHEGSLLDNISEVTTNQITRNALYLPPLTRADLNKTLTCQASNSDLAIPLSQSVTLDVTYSPTWVGVLSDSPGEVVVTEGVAHTVTCEARGARPPAQLQWWLDGRKLTSASQVAVAGEVSYSTVTLVAEAGQNGLTLTCRATTPGLPRSALTATTTLTVLYKPLLQLRAEGEAALGQVEEGWNVTFFCHVNAHPPVSTIHWARDGVPLLTEGQERLVLKSVTREASGSYTCAAANTEGARTSNTLTLTVMFLPRCSPGQKTVYGAARHEQLHVPCTVLAHPAPDSFRWAVNTSTGVVDVALNLSRFLGAKSIVLYTPQTHHDFGDLLCWAVNDLGPQLRPCVFKIIPAAKPEPVRWCTAERNASMPISYMVLACVPGWDGGLNQTFTLEVRQTAHEEVLEAFRHASDPTFIISGMKLGVQYLLTVTAANARGSSQPTTINYTATAASTDKVVSPHPNFLLGLMPILMAMGVLLVMVAACVGMGFLVAKLRRGHTIMDTRTMLQASPMRDDLDIRDGHTIVCVKECEKEEVLRNPSTVACNLYVTPSSLLNNCGKVTAEETDDLLPNRLCAPLASIDSLECSSTSISQTSTSTTVTLNPNFLVKEPDILSRNPDYLARKSDYLVRVPHFAARNTRFAHQRQDYFPPNPDFPPGKQSHLARAPEYWEEVTQLLSTHRESSV